MDSIKVHPGRGDLFPKPHDVHQYYEGYFDYFGMECVVEYHARVMKCRQTTTKATTSKESVWNI